ncbi:MAG: hypothetical protein DRG11_01995 [Epsilonproteobacteria bacterium]|nr:MAG: hypothetical protein DRG11_01995 [Campylobacterota bacterium]
MKKIIFIIIFLFDILFCAGKPVFDSVNDLQNLKIINNQVKSYQELKKTYLNLEKSLDIAQKKYKEAQELGKKIGSPIAVARGEIAWWKKEIGSMQEQMKYITKLYMNAPNEIKKMFDINSEYYQYDVTIV